MIRYLIAALIASLILLYGGWQHIESQAKDLAAATDQVITLKKAVESRRNTQKLLTQLDTEHTQELTNAQVANRQLRADIATGKRRLSVAARCPAVGASATTTGLGHAETRAELDPAAGERIVAIANDGDEGLIALRAAQDYITTVCLGARQ
ncbi:lysis system i-spanin subunit Rz [Pseudomonas sp.]|uniref:lysis system i-spanin subunit Rz n=1 Tax=Pseudomonas sp. TaxID=306 RepID=UPI0026372E24|nr:lysis system i-spanin subunit Rz [Pseudomonas sp.]